MSTIAPPATDNLFGPFAAIAALELPGMEVGDLYEGSSAVFYDEFVGADQYDVPPLLAAAEEAGGRVLELAAGSGRLALPLARAGHEVTAVDLAPDMVRLLRRRLLDESPEVAARVRPHHGDMCELDGLGTYPMAFIGAMSICLLTDHDLRVRAFKAIRGALEPGGRFLIDFLETTPEALRAQEEVIAIPAQRGPIKRFTLLGRKWLPERDIQLVNFLTEEVDPAGRTRRWLGSSAKGIVTEDQLRGQLGEAGFEVQDIRTTLEVGEGDEHERIRLLTCVPVRGT